MPKEDLPSPREEKSPPTIKPDSAGKTATVAPGAETVSGGKTPAKLTLAPPVSSPVTSATPPDGVSGGPAESSGSVLVGQKRRPAVFGIGTANKVLAVAILAVICLAVLEIRSNVMGMQFPVPPAANVLPPDEMGHVDLPSIAEIKKMFDGRSLFPTPDGGTSTNPPPQPTVLGEVAKDLRLKGRSSVATGTEVIFADAKDGKMFFVQQGQKILFRGKELTLEKIEADSVIFTDGKERVTVK